MSNLNFILSFIILFLPSELRREEARVNEYVSSVAPSEVVTLTTYTPTAEECDSTPLITASGFKINESNPKRHRIIAVSRDLKKKYKFGERVMIVGAGRLDGEYVIRDLMHQRWKNKIDILINPNDRHTKLRKIKMYRVLEK
jgi:3D (Asp-Asp-Asp) domain-containing protein